jgi:hypothetical protein
MDVSFGDAIGFPPPVAPRKQAADRQERKL